MDKFFAIFDPDWWLSGNNSALEIADAIDEFCSDYHIENEKITVEMLRKDWYRFRRRCSKDASAPIENSDF